MSDSYVPGVIQVDANLTADQFGWATAHEVGHKCLGGLAGGSNNPETWANFPGHTRHNMRDYYDPKDFPIHPSLVP